MGDRTKELAASRSKVGGAIRTRRLALGLSLAELAERLDIAVSTMSKIENGKIGTSFERLENISLALEADLVEFIGGRPGAAASVPEHAYGMRMTVTHANPEPVVDAGSYLEWFHAADMLHKRYQPIVAEILVNDVADYGLFTQHDGEEFNYVLEGEIEFHTEIYAPVRLKAGSSVYFDAEMKHAHIRVNEGPCRILAILCPRSEGAQQISPDRHSHRMNVSVAPVQPGDAVNDSGAAVMKRRRPRAYKNV